MTSIEADPPGQLALAPAGVLGVLHAQRQGPELVGTLLPTLIATLRATGADLQ